MSGRSQPEEEARHVPTGEPGRAQPPPPAPVPRASASPAPVPRASASPAAASRGAALREPPPPLEARDQLVTAVITAGWAIALVVLLIVRSYLSPGQRWWVWTPVAGLGLGLFALAYVPYLKRSRARKAELRSGQRS